MARTPNYAFERKERDRQKAEKLAEKAEAKRRAKEAEAAEGDPHSEGDAEPTD